MIVETGRIVSIETESVWVETVQKTACGSCKAERGCGQRLISQMDGHTSYIRVLLEGRAAESYQLGDEVRIGIPEEVIAKSSLIIYVIPIAVLVMTTSLAHMQFANEAVTMLGGLIGLLFGGGLVRWYSWRNRYNRELQPVLIDDSEPLYFYQPDEQHPHVAN